MWMFPILAIFGGNFAFAIADHNWNATLGWGTATCLFIGYIRERLEI